MLSKSFLIFGAIGVINTATDVGLFVTLYDKAGLPLVVANIISTSVALGISYVLNSRYTFKDSGKMTRRKIINFVTISLSAIWILQPIIISIGLYALQHLEFIHAFMELFVNNPAQFDSAVAKLASVPFTLAWNYFWYQKVVFKK